MITPHNKYLVIDISEAIEQAINYKTLKQQLDRTFFNTLLAYTGGNIAQASKISGVHRDTIRKHIKTLPIKNTPKGRNQYMLSSSSNEGASK